MMSRILVMACVLAAPSIARGQTAAEIVAANIAASGGEKAIARIENFTSKGRLTIESPFFGKLEGTIALVRVPGRGYHERVVLNPGPIEQTRGWDGTHGWEQGPSGLRTLERFEVSTLSVLSFVNPFVAVRTLKPSGLRIERLDDAEIDGRAQYVLAITTADDPVVTMYVDRRTNLVTRSRMTVSIPGVGDVQTMTDVGGYKAVAGVMLASTMTTVSEGVATIGIALDDTVVNTAVDAKRFAAPAGGQTR
jgi:hypothetical protein